MKNELTPPNKKSRNESYNNSVDVNAHDTIRGQTILFDAVFSNNELECLSLIGMGANVDARDNDGKTPLYYSIVDREESMVRFLCKQGADRDIADNDGKTPLEKVLEYEAEDSEGFYTSIITLLLELDTRLHKAIRNEDVNLCSDIIQNGYPINKEDEYGLLKLAMGNPAIFSLLIDSSVDVNARNARGGTILHDAAAKGDIDLCMFLLERGACANNTNDQGETPLYNAVDQGSIRLCMILINKGANVNMLNNDGFSVLCAAVKTGNIEICRFLLESGADIDNQKEEGGVPPLFLIIFSKSEALCNLLIENGANVNIVINGFPILCCAARAECIEICKILMDAGAELGDILTHHLLNANLLYELMVHSIALNSIDEAFVKSIENGSFDDFLKDFSLFVRYRACKNYYINITQDTIDNEKEFISLKDFVKFVRNESKNDVPQSSSQEFIHILLGEYFKKEVEWYNSNTFGEEETKEDSRAALCSALCDRDVYDGVESKGGDMEMLGEGGV